ncbi:MAG TPA: GntR family transcriptional regulator [Streptosporangiaceae bacterium]|nr:GntR family transcriptional regulator [Streptosporangiaceae bacterium]
MTTSPAPVGHPGGAGQPIAPIQPVQRPVPLRQTVYEALVDLIVGGTLPPGQHLVEAELARQLGVSRQPVREALHRLEAESWVDLRPGQGAFVHVPTEHEVDRLLDVRILLEAEAARLAATNASAAAVSRLRARLREGADALAHDDPRRVVAANAALHDEITALSGNAILAELAGIVEWRMRWHHRPVALARGRESWHEHETLIDAIEAGDAAKAAEIMRRHVEMTRLAYHGRAGG